MSEGWKIWKKGGVEFVGLKRVVKESLREAGLCSPKTVNERGSTNCDSIQVNVSFTVKKKMDEHGRNLNG